MSFTATLTSSATPAGIAELQKLKWLRVLTLNAHADRLKGEMLQELGRIPSLRQLNLITATPLDQADLAAPAKGPSQMCDPSLAGHQLSGRRH